ncbi:MAG: hypothetical protein JNL28_12010 [Planctomycetes bacterium]|nr:hypothetical protein [Planctomycetota bacterium]
MALVAGFCLFAFPGCASSVANVDPTGTRFPTVKGESLDGASQTLPDGLAGAPAVLLVGYAQGAQFDIDRWIMTLIQQKTPARVFEVPTIKGLVPTMISGWIDDGMRSGIPDEDWPAVITVYGDQAARIVATTGNEKPRNARVLLLDEAGRVVWFHDRGFSPSHALALDAMARKLAPH